jgi:hypothetical protein
VENKLKKSTFSVIKANFWIKSEQISYFDRFKTKDLALGLA